MDSVRDNMETTTSADVKTTTSADVKTITTDNIETITSADNVETTIGTASATFDMQLIY